MNNKRAIMKRILFAVLLFFVVAAALGQPAHAIAPWKAVSPQSFGSALDQEAVDLESSGHVFNQVMYSSNTCLITGIGCTGDPANQLMYMRGSAVGQIASAVDAMYKNKPADFGLWLADTGKILGFLPNTAYAQGLGVGFTGLTPLLPLWKSFRNIAYLLMAIVMIVIGFMVMFRKKIDPKTVVTAQNAIPRVIIALILITFSYAIVGIMIDFMYLALFFFIALFKSAGLQDPTNWFVNNVYQIDTAQKLYGEGNLLANMVNVDVHPLRLFGLPTDGNMDWAIGPIGAIIALLGFGSMGATGVVGAGIGLVGVAGLAMPLLHFIIAIAILFLFIRLLAFFLASYIQIIISLLLGPLQFLAEAFPGSNAFSSWFKNLVANLAVFPVGGAMFMLSALFAQFAAADTAQGIWKPPFTVLGGNNIAVSSLLSLGILFAIPSVAGSIKEALKAKPVMPMMDFGGAGGATQWLSSFYYLKGLAPQQWMDRLTNRKPPEHT